MYQKKKSLRKHKDIITLFIITQSTYFAGFSTLYLTGCCEVIEPFSHSLLITYILKLTK